MQGALISLGLPRAFGGGFLYEALKEGGSPERQLLQLEHPRPQGDHTIGKAVVPLPADQQRRLHIVQRQLPNNLQPGRRSGPGPEPQGNLPLQSIL